jgi:hypothetical protein
MRATIGFGSCVASLVCSLACGQTSHSSGDASGGQSGTGGAFAAAGRWGSSFTQAEAGRTASECDAIAETMAIEMTPGYSTAVLRFDYQSLAPLGHAFVTYVRGSTATEAQARARASAEVSFPFASAPAGDGKLLASAEKDGKWLFYTEPSDFGGVVVVATNGTPLFAGSIVWSGTGEISLPSSWSTTDFGSGCAPKQMSPAASRTFQLASGVTLDPTPATQALQSVLPSIWDTWGGGLSAITVLLYPRTVGAFDPSAAEYIVLLDGFTSGN